MTEPQIGARVVYRGRAHIVRGFTAMSVSPRRLWLEDSDGNTVEAPADDVRPDNVDDCDPSAPITR